MLIILKPDCSDGNADYQQTMKYLRALPNIEVREHMVQGQQHTLTEIYLLGQTRG